MKNVSYIRNGSNPEHLYIFADDQNVVEFNQGIALMGTCKRADFEGLCESYCKNIDYSSCGFGDLQIDQNFDTGFFELTGTSLRKIEMYYVTWFYLCHSVLRQRITKPNKWKIASTVFMLE